MKNLEEILNQDLLDFLHQAEGSQKAAELLLENPQGIFSTQKPAYALIRAKRTPAADKNTKFVWEADRQCLCDKEIWNVKEIREAYAQEEMEDVMFDYGYSASGSFHGRFEMPVAVIVEDGEAVKGYVTPRPVRFDISISYRTQKAEVSIPYPADAQMKPFVMLNGDALFSVEKEDLAPQGILILADRWNFTRNSRDIRYILSPDCKNDKNHGLLASQTLSEASPESLSGTLALHKLGLAELDGPSPTLLVPSSCDLFFKEHSVDSMSDIFPDSLYCMESGFQSLVDGLGLEESANVPIMYKGVWKSSDRSGTEVSIPFLSGEDDRIGIYEDGPEWEHTDSWFCVFPGPSGYFHVFLDGINITWDPNTLARIVTGSDDFENTILRADQFQQGHPLVSATEGLERDFEDAGIPPVVTEDLVTGVLEDYPPDIVWAVIGWNLARRMAKIKNQPSDKQWNQDSLRLYQRIVHPASVCGVSIAFGDNPLFPDLLAKLLSAKDPVLFSETVLQNTFSQDPAEYNSLEWIIFNLMKADVPETADLSFAELEDLLDKMSSDGFLAYLCADPGWLQARNMLSETEKRDLEHAFRNLLSSIEDDGFWFTQVRAEARKVVQNLREYGLDETIRQLKNDTKDRRIPWRNNE